MSATKKPDEIWAELNGRQREYLKAVYKFDQAAEAANTGGDWFGRRRPPASEWRWLPYTANPVTGEASDLLLYLREKKLVSPGTGSTFQALEARGLILCRYEDHSTRFHADSWLFVQITTLGRKVIRQAAGEQREKPLPRGTLQEWHWKALALAYKVGSEGVPPTMGDNYGRIGWNTWLRLREYKWGALVTERIDPKSQDLKANPPRLGHHNIYITDFGRQYYEREYKRYRELYPSVEAEPPAGSE